MVASSYAPIDILVVVELVNNYSTPTRLAAGEIELDLPSRPATVHAGTDTLTDAELISIADDWFEVFAALPDLDRVGTVLNSALENHDAVARARSDARTLRLAIEVREGATKPERLLVEGFLSLLDWLSKSNPESLGICAADNCVDVFCDRSPRQNRSYCSSLCQTRERVRRHRQRR